MAHLEAEDWALVQWLRLGVEMLEALIVALGVVLAATLFLRAGSGFMSVVARPLGRLRAWSSATAKTKLAASATAATTAAAPSRAPRSRWATAPGTRRSRPARSRPTQERASMRGVCRLFGIGRNTLSGWLKKSPPLAAAPRDSGSRSPR